MLYPSLAMSNASDAPVAEAGPWDTFDAFSPTHFVTVGLSLMMVGVLALLAVQVRGTRYENVMRFWLVWALVAVQAVSVIYYVFPWDPLNSLPLHVCDLAGFVAVLAVAGRNRVLRATLYYWGIALSTQAFITPVLGSGPAHVRFYLFWITHVAIIGAAVYELVARGFRPTWRDFQTVTVVTLCYAAFIIPLDIWLKADYGYAGEHSGEGSTTLLNVLGPWPLRLVWMFVLTESIFALLTVVWTLGGKRGGPPATDGSSGGR